MVEQCEEFGAERTKDTVVDFDFESKIKTIKCEKQEYKAKLELADLKDQKDMLEEEIKVMMIAKTHSIL